MDQQLELPDFDFRVKIEVDRPRAIELDTRCSTAIQRLSYTVDEIGEICTEMKDILAHGEFIPWYESKGLTQNQIAYATKRIKERAQSALGIVEINDFHLFDTPEPAPIAERAESTRQIEDAQRARQIAQDRLAAAEIELRSKNRQIAQTQEDLQQMQAQVNKLKQRLATTPLPEVRYIEKEVRVGMEELGRLQRQVAEEKKRADLLGKTLEKERTYVKERVLEVNEGENAQRIRFRWATATREFVGNARKFLSEIPSAIDQQEFEADDRQRRDEALAVAHQIIQALENTQQAHTVNANDRGMRLIQGSIVDAG